MEKRKTTKKKVVKKPTSFKKFKSQEEVDKHREEEHADKSEKIPIPEYKCTHPAGVWCFTGLVHMDRHKASGMFQQECSLCGEKFGPEKEIKYRVLKEGEEESIW
jgi:hypothetical protein